MVLVMRSHLLGVISAAGTEVFAGSALPRFSWQEGRGQLCSAQPRDCGHSPLTGDQGRVWCPDVPQRDPGASAPGSARQAQLLSNDKTDFKRCESVTLLP